MTIELTSVALLLVLVVALGLYRIATLSARLRRAERALLSLSRAMETSVRLLEGASGVHSRKIDHIVASLVAAGIKPVRME